MQTPTGSVLNRDSVDSSFISQVVYENEVLKIELESLREKLESTGLLTLDDLRCENESLKAEVAKLRVQLTEKANQLDLHRTSNDRFSNINESLHELLTQVQKQRTELAEMKDTTREKEERIENLTAELKQSEEALKEATQRASLASEEAKKSSAEAADRERLQSQLNQAKAEMETLLLKSTQEATELQSRLREAEERLLSAKEDAVAKSALWERQVSLQQQEIKECRETEARAQQQLRDLQAKMEVLRAECSQLRETNADLLQREQVSATMESQRINLNAPEVKAHVEKMVMHATEGMERRLREQVDQNTSLISRLALMQQESQATAKPKDTSSENIQLMKERVSMLGCHNDTRTTMQRRMAELLSNDELNKKDIERLLEEMLDFQEETVQENRTLLLIKDIESEERERKLEQELKRVKNENASLMKQLQELAVEGFQRERSNMLNASGGGGTSEPSGSEAGPSTAPGAPTGGMKLSATPENERGSYQLLGSSPPVLKMEEVRGPAHPASLNTSYNALHQDFRTPPAMHPTVNYAPVPSQQMPVYQRPPAASPYQQPPQQREPKHSPRHYTGDLWSNTSARPTTAPASNPQRAATTMAAGCAEPYRYPSDTPPNKPGAQPAWVPRVSGTEPDRSRSIRVQCPACTFEQQGTNRQCEICQATLQLN
ncbi:conserved hypothetical protein [Leishmania major strain Friedlin]|uniref:Uncharacterized protein n=1 Tax=Leishmania major TaxID=5664 RepID=Q4Q387_LEIMA|nr:conserved hypothetical protein [Leishmania major strain Friedlin]CAG9581949.1 hypothetical_protein_-_conserved [Leishmania major strain Friedlin]CAG9581951.1 hypothetical_protein_-_conserved [Leishmania major strain Friedlin]CAJ07825.1 conserved hypothetical protein [Leishmania major strain Friedlin]|eukprot:XP_001686211.1 conserved hypothetical protein [Leishmania major strain Friedlin]